MRPGGRAADELRPVRFTRRFTEHAEGSVLCEFGGTRVLCTASVENGASWVPDLLHRLDDAANRNPGYFAEAPRDIFG